MLKFTGDWDNLEGKVVIYSKLLSGKCHNIPEGTIYAFYLTTDPLDLLEHFSGSEVVSTVGDQIKETIENIVKEVAEKIDVSQAVPVYVSPLNVGSEEEFPDVNETLHVGNYSCPDRCKTALTHGLHLYLLNHMEQLFFGLGVDHKRVQNGSRKTYKDFIKGGQRQEINDYIMHTYVGPMIEAKTREDTNGFQSLRNGLIDFSAGAIFAKDAIELCRFVEDSGKNLNQDIVWLYVNKMNAVHTENYEEAAKLRDRIKTRTK